MRLSVLPADDERPNELGLCREAHNHVNVTKLTRGIEKDCKPTDFNSSGWKAQNLSRFIHSRNKIQIFDDEELVCANRTREITEAFMQTHWKEFASLAKEKEQILKEYMNRAPELSADERNSEVPQKCDPNFEKLRMIKMKRKEGESVIAPIG